MNLSIIKTTNFVSLFFLRVTVHVGGTLFVVLWHIPIVIGVYWAESHQGYYGRLVYVARRDCLDYTCP